MKTIPLATLQDNPSLLADLADTLATGGLVCLPCGGSYRILADLNDPEAVTGLLQSKRRTRQAPSLVFVDTADMLGRVVGDVPAAAKPLMAKLWPGPLTILFPPSPALPEKVTKQLTRFNGNIGVRIPGDTVVRGLVTAFGRPVLVSSANRQEKKGAESPAQVRKNFVSRVDVFVDAGDLPPAPKSTVVDLADGVPTIRRPGAISEAAVRAAAGI